MKFKKFSDHIKAKKQKPILQKPVHQTKAKATAQLMTREQRREAYKAGIKKFRGR